MRTEPPGFPRVVRVMDGALALALLLVMGIGLYLALTGHAWPPTPRAAVVWALIASPPVIAIAVTRLAPMTRASFTLVILSIGIAVYGIDIFLEYGVDKEIARLVRDDVGPELDERDPLEIVARLRARGENAYPFIVPMRWMSQPLKVNGKPRLPLGGVANVTTVGCNETGEYFIYRSDPAGLNNPAAVWREEKADVMLVGDSFAQGFCVPAEHSFASLLRTQFPRTVNLGYAHNGPLMELAGLREYGPRFEPDHVFWFLYEGNDLGVNLYWELRSTLLRKYLADPGFRQPSVPPSRAINEGIKRWADRKIKSELSSSPAADPPPAPDSPPPPDSPPEPSLADIVFLRALRSRVSALTQPDEPTADVPTADAPMAEQKVAEDPVGEEGATPRMLRVFRRILLRARQDVARWDGQLHLVYLPSFLSISEQRPPFDREELAGIATELEVNFIDLYEVFSRHPDPLKLFPFEQFGHYSIEGNALVADTVLDTLRASD